VKISLRAARVNANLKQTDITKELKISKNTLISWEKGITSPPFDRVIQLCKIYQVSVNDIFLPSRF